jgi:hypothetical protein
MNKGDLVMVEWVDADSDAGWQPDDPVADDVAETMKSYGLLVSRGRKFITLSHCYNVEAREWLGKHRIPIAFVTDVVVLEEF